MLKNLLIVSPHFPPINTPDMQRVRTSLPHYKKFGWEPIVLTVDEKYIEGIIEHELLKSIPDTIELVRVRAFPLRITRKFGISNIGIRSLLFLYKAGSEVIKQKNIDLVFFTTTIFVTFILGRIWKRKYGVPYIFDFQDPWVSDYYDSKPNYVKPKKYWISKKMHEYLEPWAMKEVDGIISVTDKYNKNLCNKYSWLSEKKCTTIPFAASELDFNISLNKSFENIYFTKEDNKINGVYIGVLGNIMKDTCYYICSAFKNCLELNNNIFSNVRLHFIGTSYATYGSNLETIKPIANRLGIGEYINEHTKRIPYYSVLRILNEADFLLVIGSDNPDYTPSKVYQYILTKKPLLVIFHKDSSLINFLERVNAGEFVTYSSEMNIEDIINNITYKLSDIVRKIPYEPFTNWEYFNNYSALSLTKKQCEFFNYVIGSYKLNNN